MDLTDLALRLTSDLARYFDLADVRDPVHLQGDGQGGIALARVDLTGAKLDVLGALTLDAETERPPDLLIDRLELSARPLLVEGARVWLEGSAQSVGLAVAGGPPRFVTLAGGNVKGSVDRQELEEAAQVVVHKIAAGYGVQVNDFKLTLASPQPHVLAGLARVLAGRRVLGASIKASVAVAGSLESLPGEGLTLRDITCQGEGPLGTLVSSFLTPQLRRLAGTILTLPIIPGRIADASFDLGEAITLQADLHS